MRHPYYGDDDPFAWTDPFGTRRRQARRPQRNAPAQYGSPRPQRVPDDDPLRRPAPYNPQPAVEPQRDRQTPQTPQPTRESWPESATDAEPLAFDPVPEPATSKDDLRDALRELQAAKQRVERDAARVKDETRRNLIEDLLPVIDNLDRSLAASADTSDPALRQGVQLVRDQFERVLLGYGVERLPSAGVPFDPKVHDAIAVVDVDDPNAHNVVIDEWQPGYRLGDRVLRAAKVRVGKASGLAGRRAVEERAGMD